MRDLPVEFGEDQQKLSFAELYEFELTTGITYYYTSHSENINWGGQLYTTVPLQRSPISQKMNLESDTVQISLANMTSEFASVIQKNILDGAKVTIKRIAYDGDAGVGAYLILFVGRASVSHNRQTVILSGVSILDSLNVQTPCSLYQEPCNNRLFDAPCNLTKSNYKYQGTATSDGGDCFTIKDTSFPVYKVAFDGGDENNPIEIGDTITGGNNSYTAAVVAIVYTNSSTGYIWYVDLSNPANFENNEVLSDGADTVTVNGTPEEDKSFYTLGEIAITSGDSSGVRRMIRATNGDDIYVAVAVPYEIKSGVTFDVYPGCDKRPETCEQKFGNDDNFNGYIYIARPEEALYGGAED